jgi:DNA-binding NtrC family response regulator
METPPKPRNQVAVAGTDEKEVMAICRFIEEGEYRTTMCHSLAELEATLSEPCMAAILDLDSVQLDNRTIRALTHRHPATCFLCASRAHFHPDLQDAIGHHLFACLVKPVDPDELHYFLRCIRDSQRESRGPPLQEG